MDVNTMREAVRLSDEITKHEAYLKSVKKVSGTNPIRASFYFYSGLNNQPPAPDYHLDTATVARIVSAKLKSLRASLKELHA